ncbi:3-mercaptopyruvate sulfurtransferase SseA [Bradyrhizobium sp. LM3.2]
MPQPTPLITTEQLAAQLGDPNLRLYDCTTYNEPVPPGSDVPYRAVPGDKTFEAGHIPGADFLRPAGRVLRRLRATILHDAWRSPAGGRLRPPRPRC